MNPVIAQWADQPWAMDERRLQKLHERVNQIDLPTQAPDSAAISGRAQDRKDPGYRLQGSVAVIDVVGDIWREIPWGYGFSGCRAVSTLAVSEALRAAMNDPMAQSVLFNFDSPGGTVPGVQELAGEIYAARKAGQKPVCAYVSALCCSAAYWLASQAERISASPTSKVGSIGVYTAVTDYSRAYENEGLRVHLIATGRHKATGYPGVPISSEQLQPLQENIDDLLAAFAADVARGRGMPVEKVMELASGRTWVAPRALQNGLIDAVESPDQAFVACDRAVERRRQESAATVVPDAKAGETGEAAQTERHETESQSAGSSGGSVAGGSREPSPEKEREMGEGKEQAAGAAISTAGPSREEIVKAEHERMSSLKAAFPNDPAFALECFEKNLDVSGAKALAFDRAQDKAKAGTSAVTHADASAAEERRLSDERDRAKEDEDKSAWERLDAKISAHMKEHKSSRREASSAVISENKDLHAEFLEEQRSKARSVKAAKR